MVNIESLHLPQDAEVDKLTTTSPPSSAEGSSTSPSDPLTKLITKVKTHPNDLSNWDKLISEYERLIDNSESPQSVSQDIKDGIKNTYKSLLSRFPYLISYWKNWSIMEYKINGTQASIKVLEIGIENFPQCVSLWVDYLSALISTFGEDLKTKEENVKKIREVYGEGLRYNGYHFNSHSLWDKVFEFEKGLMAISGGNSTEVLGLYLRVIKVPLYEYAKYYNQFTEICKSYDIQSIVPKERMESYLEKFNKTKLEHLSLIEKHQIIDDYTYSVFSETQAKVNSNWQFESSLEYQEFSIKNLKEIAKEQETWISYIDKEQSIYLALLIQANDTTAIQNQFDLVQNLYQRCLIPNCLDSKIWLKYIEFLHKSHLKPDEKFETIQQVYQLAISKFIPIDENKFRFIYGKFLLRYEKYDAVNEYLFDWLKFTSGSSGSNTVYYKSSYLETIKEICDVWIKLLGQGRFVEICDRLIVGYFDKIDRYTKKKQPTTTKKSDAMNGGYVSDFELSEKFISSVGKFLNDESICVIVGSYLNIISRDAGGSNTEKIRKFFNKYHKENCFKKSILFWKFYFDFETIQNHNIHNVRYIINYIRNETQLPKIFIDNFIDLNYEFSSANILGILSETNGSSDPMMIMRDLDKSNSIFYNKSSWKRLAKNNYLIKDKSTGHHQFEEELVKLSQKHIGHPGVLVEVTPDITNKIMNEGNEIDLSDPELQIPPLPTYKNVEKASAPINFPKE
ncbi:PRP39 [[Candida] subhashii]|uniref:PRP39 n=1 Tax=[Candida] subhashii TaxID=561895 RepID=A0A8J5UKH1_9ASCO|nr:PRP39 [[Candida] subhashii]KAG7665508.1 PRP39 [[Candida] subhashii]